MPDVINFLRDMEGINTIVVFMIAYILYLKPSIATQSERKTVFVVCAMFGVSAIWSGLILDYVLQGGAINKAAWHLSFVFINVVALYELKKFHIDNEIKTSKVAFAVGLALIAYTILQTTRLIEKITFKTKYLSDVYTLMIPSIDWAVCISCGFVLVNHYLKQKEKGVSSNA